MPGALPTKDRSSKPRRPVRRLAPFLSEHFGRAVYVWQYPFDEALVEAERPDVVVFEMVERSLMNVDPATIVPAARP